MMMLSALFRQLRRDDRGSMVVWTTVGLSSVFAMGALLLDGERMYNLQSQMQSYADHVALAAAAELDGSSDAIERAIRAATGGSAGPIVTDTQNYSSGGDALAVSEMHFLSKLGTGMGTAGSVAGDVVQYSWTGGASAATATQSQVSRFVEVKVAPRNVTFVMAPVLAALGIGQGATSGAVSTNATAGFTRAACKFPPMMMCNPDEDQVTGGGPFNWQAAMGKQILLRTQAPGAAWGPGDFGFLDLTDFQTGGACSGGGASLLRCVMALVDPGTQCVLQGGEVDLEPGQMVGPVRVSLNTRFDMWDAPYQNKRTDAAFAPARNVIRGVTHLANQCGEGALTPAPSMRLPRDVGLSVTNRVGPGATLAQLQTYWSTNHPSTPWPFASGVTPTRYDIYRQEIELNDATPGSMDPPGEIASPTCASAPVTEPSPMDPVKDRRVLLIAVVNCKEYDIHGAQANVPVENFALVFLTEPVGLDDSLEPGIVPIVGKTNEDILGEMIGIVKANTSAGVLHEFPVLYR